MLAGLDGPRAILLWWTLPSFMVLIAAALMISLGILFWETRRSWTLRQAADSMLIALAFGLFGARIEHVALNWDYFANVPSEVWNVASGGLNAHGAILGAVAGGYLSARLFQKSFGPWLNAAAYALCLISIATWWGCAAASCAYGTEVGNLADYPSWLVWEAQGDFLMVAPRYAVQPIGAIASGLLLGAVGLSATLRVKARWRATLALVGIMIVNFALGFLRGDSMPVIGILRATQVMNLTFAATAVLLAVWLRRQSVPAA